MDLGQVWFGLGGLAVSVYAYYVKKQRNQNPNYRALCDFGENASCSRVLTSKYGIGLGLTSSVFGENSRMNASNVSLGIAFYMLQIIAGMINVTFLNQLAFVTSFITCLVSIYLAYILAFVLQDFCLVCVVSYFFNFTLFWSNIQRIS